MIVFIGHLYQNLCQAMISWHIRRKNVFAKLLEGPVYKSIKETSEISLYFFAKSENEQYCQGCI